MMSDQPCKQRRGKAAARADTSEDETVDKAALLHGYPARDKLVCRGIDDRFTRAEGEPNRDQQRDGVRNARWKHCCESGCNTPPHYPDGENAPRPEARREPSCWKLKAGVSDQEGAEDPAQPLVAESVLCADLQAGD